jgi:hypothetical protein
VEALKLTGIDLALSQARWHLLHAKEPEALKGHSFSRRANADCGRNIPSEAKARHHESLAGGAVKTAPFQKSGNQRMKPGWL